MPNLHSQTYEIQVETVRQAVLNLFKIHEVPITFVGPEKGKLKLAGEECRGFLMYVAKAVLFRREAMTEKRSKR